MARDIAKVLGHFNYKDGYMENSQYIITWAIGHLVQLAEPEDYDISLKKWSLDRLPFIPTTFKLRPANHAREQLKIIQKLLRRRDVVEVINACDAGREGELIFRYIYTYCRCRKPIKRLWLSETTAAAVKKAFKNLRSSQEYDFLAAAAQLRAQADWIIGMNGTRAFSAKHGPTLSVGRVQTPTLALVVAREDEIRNFVPQHYWELWADFLTPEGDLYRGKWFGGDRDRFDTQDEAERVKAKVLGKPGQVTSVDKEKVSEPPPLLYNLTDLQRDANRILGLTAERTLDIAQDLYERHKLLTYPRTESRHLTADLAATLNERLAALGTAPEYAKLADSIDASSLSESKRYVNDAKVTDHHAVIPTPVAPDLVSLDENERAVYDLVARRFLAAFYPAAEYQKTSVVTTVESETFVSSGRVEITAGWKKVYRDTGDQATDKLLPPLIEGQKVIVRDPAVIHKKTQPPPRYTEDTLLAAMEHAGRYVDDAQAKDLLKKAGGLGTPATRAAIIERLCQVQYLTRKGKTLVPTPKGELLLSLMPDEIKSPELTARWEEKLGRIERGKGSPREFLNGIIAMTENLMAHVRSQEPSPDLARFKKKFPKTNTNRTKHGGSGKKENPRVAPGLNIRTARS